MTKFGQRIKLGTVSGEPVRVDGVTVTPQSRALTVRWPRGGWVWNRPVAVLVERGEKEERQPIVDVTRLAQMGLFGLGLLFVVVGFVLWMMKRSMQDEQDL